MNSGKIRRRILPWVLAILLILAVAGGWLGHKWHREHEACLRRGAALDARIKKLEADAKRRILIGTKREEIVGFLQENVLNVSFRTDLIPRQIVGTTRDIGCVQIFGCGDEVLIGVEVDVDENETAIAAAKVDEMGSNCM